MDPGNLGNFGGTRVTQEDPGQLRVTHGNRNPIFSLDGSRKKRRGIMRIIAITGDPKKTKGN